MGLGQNETGVPGKESHEMVNFYNRDCIALVPLIIIIMSSN